MQKQTSFWIGIFITIIFILPILLGTISNAENYAIRYSGFLAGFGFCLIFILIISLFFRDAILRKITGNAKTNFDELTNEVMNVVFSIRDKETEQVTQAATNVTQTFTNWYLWTKFYRWVIATSIALLVAAAGFMGTVLLAKQNSIMNFQNELQVFETQGIIRQQLVTPKMSKQDLFDELEVEADFRTLIKHPVCEISAEMTLSGDRYSQTSNSSTLETVSNLFDNDQMAPLTQNVLESLLLDNDSGVALSSFYVLDELNRLPSEFYIPDLKRITIISKSIKHDASLFAIKDSIIVNLECDDCEKISFDRSLINDIEFPVSGNDNFVFGDYFDESSILNMESFFNSLILLEDATETNAFLDYFSANTDRSGNNWYAENISTDLDEIQNRAVYEIKLFPGFNHSEEIRATLPKNLDCTKFLSLCANNEFLNCSKL